VDLGALWQLLQRELQSIRAQYVAAGRAEEFEQHVAALKSDGRWPFGE
jgi:hypothetical protein